MDRDVGLEVYLTTTRGIGGRLKSQPEDFVVEEVARLPPRIEGGPFTAALVRTRNWETNRLVRQLARTLRIGRRRIAFAGTKDKRAVSTRVFTFLAPVEAIATLRMKDVEVLDAFPTDRAVEIGGLLGNRFRVVIRELEVGTDEARRLVDETRGQLEGLGGFPNFFGVQRFGVQRPITHIVGRHIVRGALRDAVEAYVANPVEGEDPESFAARTRFAETGDVRAALKELPRYASFERAALNHLTRHPDDWVGALNELPLNLLMMFVHAYESWLFNRILSERIRRGLPLAEPVPGDLVLPAREDGLPDRTRTIPVEDGNLEKAVARCREGRAFVSHVLPGSDVPFATGEPGEIERAVVAGEDLRPEDFVVPAIPRISSRGTRREILVRVPDLSVTVDPDGAAFAFSLPRGAYATSLLREFTKNERYG